MTRLAVFLATAGYSGYFPIAPGTVGSAVGLLVYAAVGCVQSPVLPIVEVLVIVCLFAAGVWAGTTAERHFGGIDPGPIVLDEVVGMLMTLAFIPVGLAARSPVSSCSAFSTSIKPFPARRFEALHGGLGVMADDAMAAIYANVSLRLLMALFPLWVA